MTKQSDSIGLILRAAQFAAHKHTDQRRKDTNASPYINHPIALANILRHEGQVQDAMVIAAALLHDTIEDTETSYEELRGQFGVKVAEIVVEVTDTKWLQKKSRKREYFDWAKEVVDHLRGASPKLVATLRSAVSTAAVT